MTSGEKEQRRDPNASASDGPRGYKYDVAVSFAGEQRDFVEQVVRGLGLPKAQVFYDADYKPELWGEVLSEKLTRVYRDEARYVVMFISREYADKEWCRLERRAALRRFMQTRGAYILPVRLDTTTLDEVEGLLGTIGYLDGLREGVAGVTECLRQKLGAVLAESEESQAQDDRKPRFGEVQTTQEGLVALLQERPNSWRWAAFVSVLVQRRAALESAIRDHRLRFAAPTGERVNDLNALQDLKMGTISDVDQLNRQMDGFVRTDAFRSVFGTKDDESAADPDGIVHVANRLMDFYERYLQLAQRARGAAAPAKYLNVLDTCARLVDEPLKNLDAFIDEYVELVGDAPEIILAAKGQKTIVRPIVLRIQADDDVLEELNRQIKAVVASGNE